MTQRNYAKKQIAAELRAHIGRAKVNKTELAELADISRASFNRKLNGEVSFTVEELLRVEKSLNLDTGSLFKAGTQG